MGCVPLEISVCIRSTLGDRQDGDTPFRDSTYGYEQLPGDVQPRSGLSLVCGCSKNNSSQQTILRKDQNFKFVHFVM